jgi:hypothetical protein
VVLPAHGPWSGAGEVGPRSLRWRASLWDYLVIVGWLAFLTVLGLIVRPLLLAGAPTERSVSPPRRGRRRISVLTVLPRLGLPD